MVFLATFLKLPPSKHVQIVAGQQLCTFDGGRILRYSRGQMCKWTVVAHRSKVWTRGAQGVAPSNLNRISRIIHDQVLRSNGIVVIDDRLVVLERVSW